MLKLNSPDLNRRGPEAARGDASSDSESSGSSVDLQPVESLRRYWWMGALAAVLVLGGGVPFALHKGAPLFTADAVVSISPNLTHYRPDEAPEPGRAYEDLLAVQLQDVARPELMVAALNRLGEEGETWRKEGESVEAAALRLSKQVSASRVEKMSQMAIDMYSPRKQGLDRLVNAVAETYVDRAVRNFKNSREERMVNLSAEKRRLDEEIAKKLDSRASLARALIMGSGRDSSSSLQADMLTKTQGDLALVRQRRIEAEAQLASFKSGQPGGRTPLMALAEEQSAGEAGLVTLKTTLNQRRATLLGQLADLGPNHPMRKSIEEQLKDIDRQLQQAADQISKQTADRMVQKLTAEAEKARTMESQLQLLLEKQITTAGQASAKSQNAADLALEIDRLRAQANAADDKLRALTAETDPSSLIKVLTPAAAPLLPSKDGRKKLLMIVVVFALGLGVAIPVGVDFMNQRVRGPKDIERLLGVPPAGLLLDDAEPVGDFAREHLLRLVTAIERACRNERMKTFVVTSVTTGGGTTRVVELLGPELNARGLNTLSIDASGFAHPGEITVAQQAPLPAEKNPERTVNAGPAEPEERLAVQFGRNMAGEAPLARIHEFPRSVEELSQDYDIVLIDAPPLLISADTEYLARVCDVTVVVTQAGEVRPAQLRRVTKRLEQIMAPAMAIVLNRMKADHFDSDMRSDLKEYQARSERVRKSDLTTLALDRPSSSGTKLNRITNDTGVSDSATHKF